jgi:CHASE2 domain-containing sensor protein
MSKLVVLRLDGNSETSGFQVTLAIGEDGALPTMELPGQLPPNPELASHVQHHWQDKYRPLGAPSRINPKKITYEGSVNNPIQGCKDSAIELRSRLRSWLDSKSFRPLDRQLRTQLSPNEEIRFLIRTEEPSLQKLPWQEWDFFEHYPLAEVALSGTKLERTLTLTSTFGTSQVRILAILGHSEGLDIEQDRQLLESLPEAKITFLVEKTHQEINQQLWEQPWDILFFAGHSETEGETGRIYINSTQSLTIDELRYGLKKALAQGLKIAIFNSCDGLGLARQLHDLQIPQTIVMREPVPDYVAQEFLKYFLTAFARGKSFYLAVREARERLQGLESEYPCASWLPIIYQNLAQVPPTWQNLIQEESEIEVTDNPPNPPSQGGRKNDETVSLSSSPQSLWRGWQKVLLASAIATSLVMGVRSLGLLQLVELKAFDQLMQLRPDEGPDERLLIVEVTEEDLRLPEQQQRKPEQSISDLALYRLLQKLESYQPRAIGLDIFRDPPFDPKLAELKTYLRQNNRLFAICNFSEPGKENGVSPPPDFPKERQGFSNIKIDSDGIVRRHLLSTSPLSTSPCVARNALSLQLALHYLKAEEITPKITPDGNWQLGQVVFKRLKAPVGAYQKDDTWGNQVILNYRSYRSPSKIAETVTLTQVLKDGVNPEFVKDVKDGIILIGVSRATSDKNEDDKFPTPYDQKMPGVKLHAQMVSQILSAVLDKRPLIQFWPLWGEVLWMGSWSLVGGVLVWRMRSIYLLLAGGVALGVLCGLSYCLLVKGYWVPLVPSVLAAIATGGCVIVCSKGSDIKLLASLADFKWRDLRKLLAKNRTL